jgi:hypothetical protein
MRSARFRLPGLRCSARIGAKAVKHGRFQRGEQNMFTRQSA